MLRPAGRGRRWARRHRSPDKAAGWSWRRCLRRLSRAPRTCGYRTAPRKMRRKTRSEEHTSELQSRGHLVCRLLLEKKKKTGTRTGANLAGERFGFAGASYLAVRAAGYAPRRGIVGVVGGPGVPHVRESIEAVAACR